MIFKLKATIDETEFEVKALFGMETNVSTADARGETLQQMLESISVYMNPETQDGFEILKFAKQITYYGYLSYCNVFDIEPKYSEKTVSVVFDHVENLESTIFEWGKVYFGTMPKSNDTPTPDTKKK